jgi:2-aminomuconate deaminase
VESLGVSERDETAPDIRVLRSMRAPTPVGAYAHATLAGGFLFVSGQGARDVSTGREVGVELDDDGHVLRYDVAAQTTQVLANLRTVLAEAGATFGNLVDVMVFLRSMDDFAAYNEVYARHFTAHMPARTTVAVAALPGRNAIEIKATAWIGAVRRDPESD